MREAEMLGRVLAPYGMGHPNLRRFLKRITNPSLVVWGANDRVFPSGQGELWRDALPNGRLQLVNDAGHLVLQEAPEAVEAIAEFLME